MWVKYKNKYMQIVEYNMMYDEESDSAELWITRHAGNSQRLLKTTVEQGRIYESMFRYAIEHSLPFIEM